MPESQFVDNAESNVQEEYWPSQQVSQQDIRKKDTPRYPEDALDTLSSNKKSKGMSDRPLIPFSSLQCNRNYVW